MNKIVVGSSLNEIVFKLIEWSDVNGKVNELVNAAYRHNSGNDKLNALINRSGNTFTRLDAKGNASQERVDIGLFLKKFTDACTATTANIYEIISTSIDTEYKN